MREITFRIIQAGKSNVKWMRSVVANTTVSASKADLRNTPNFDNIHGPAPRNRTKVVINAIMMRRGIHALRSDDDGIIVLLTVNVR